MELRHEQFALPLVSLSANEDQRVLANQRLQEPGLRDAECARSGAVNLRDGLRIRGDDE